MRAIVSTLLFLMMQSCDVTGSGCRDDRDKDHRSRVSCVNQGLTALPGGIKPLTQVLVLTGNHLTSLSWSDYSAFTDLYELNLSHNDIAALEPPGPVLENLSVLRLSGNRLTGLGGGVFRCAPRLMEIYLSDNQIRSLHDATFSHLQHLEVIHLSGNKLPALPPRLLERVSSSRLKTFDLENNSVSLMPDGFFSSKPDLHYVYLSYNPWLCSCSVRYLHFYLYEQEDTVYKHNHDVNKPEGQNNFAPGADSVLCAGPHHLSGRPIIALKEEDFCPPEPMILYPTGDLDVFWDLDVSDAHVPTTHTPPHTSPSVTSWSYIWYKVWTHSQTESESKYLFSSKVTQTESSPLISSEHFTKDPTTATILMTQSTVSNSTQPQTTSLTPDRPKPLKTTAHITDPPESTSVQPQATSTGPQWPDGADGRVVGVRVLPWCGWLFAGFVLLCLLSALTCCFLFLWLLRNYLLLYRRLQRYGPRHSVNDGATLLAYRHTDSTEPRGEVSEDRVTFLTPELIKDTRAVFRSVLYISKEEREALTDVQIEANGRDASTTAAERERAVTFRKTLHRVISAEQTHNRWTEEEEHWDENTERRATRYSLVLRENTGRETNIEWLMGEWMMGERGVVYERDPAL